MAISCLKGAVLTLAAVFSFTLLYSFSSIFVYFSISNFIERTTPKLYFEHALFYNFTDSVPSFQLLLAHRPEWFQVDETGAIHIKQVTITFDMPDSPKNTDLGKFMVNLHLLNDSKTFNSQRFVTIKYKSGISKVTYSVFYMFPILFGLLDERNVYDVEMLTNKDSREILDFNTKLSEAKALLVTLSSQDPEIYQSKISFYGDIVGYRYYLYQYRYIAISLILIFLLVVEFLLVFSVFTSSCLISTDSKNDHESEDEIILPDMTHDGQHDQTSHQEVFRSKTQSKPIPKKRNKAKKI